ncbi:hypothetical protein AEAC466_14910 [Asticcacaulis sp. AC466]|uniref:hypothetical protein n=1 Tax=Asticcacaulis sp. AC466 TaxID=1282362 RepID=UPI0003C3B42E|nr:hypothetical protein [Asticcacaulis sp. AC466]ESQ83149.1 hypothetical protein AEAC466_14910 [Asticcacaulis sp. AC466]
MDALTVLRRLTGFKPLLLLFMLFCAWPVVAGLYHMLTHGAWILMDIDAVLCGAKTLASGHSPYAIHPPSCGGNRPAAYVYAPQVAHLFVPFIDALGINGARTLFLIALLAPATLFLLWFALVKRFDGIDIRWRWLAFAALTPMTFVCANVGIVMHAMVLASLFFFRPGQGAGDDAGDERWRYARWPFTVTVLLCSCVKPTFLAYFVIFLLDDIALWRRGFAFSWRAVAGVAVNQIMILTDGHYGKAWQKTLHSVTLARQPGMGWFELTNFVFHVPGKSDLNWQLALGFMAVMTLAGMAIAHWGRMDDDERLLFGMGLVPLMTPRILDYDMILIVPYAALLMAVAYRVGGGVFRFLLSWLFTGWMVWGILTYILHIEGWHRTPMAMLLFGCLTVIVALRAAMSGVWPSREQAGSAA